MLYDTGLHLDHEFIENIKLYLMNFKNKKKSESIKNMLHKYLLGC